ncbi:TetR/AcrR family transcriptional regulator [Thalassobacillus hwangdonensis]|uniref:TetR/AcrR family transcriptional regulator n=1 Tax=Thalassobacillus hwangdonensis TaxID=546108 RepID=A0ABW3L0X8_9BACI
MAPRKAVKQELTREIVLDTARELFVKQGFQGVTLRKIAKELGYSHGSIYYHFNNKAELFFALVELDFAKLDQTMEGILDLDLSNREKLKAILLGYIEFGLTYQHHYDVMFMTKDEDLKSYLEEGPNRSYDKFAQSIYSLTSTKLTVQKIWSVFLMLHGFVSHYCHKVEGYDEVRTMAETYAEDILAGILQE